jgi:hypothetical protein
MLFNTKYHRKIGFQENNANFMEKIKSLTLTSGSEDEDLPRLDESAGAHEALVDAANGRVDAVASGRRVRGAAGSDHLVERKS